MDVKRLVFWLLVPAGLLILAGCAPVRNDEPYYGWRRSYPYDDPYYYRGGYYDPYHRYGYPYSRFERDDWERRRRWLRQEERERLAERERLERERRELERERRELRREQRRAEERRRREAEIRTQKELPGGQPGSDKSKFQRQRSNRGQDRRDRDS